MASKGFTSILAIVLGIAFVSAIITMTMLPTSPKVTMKYAAKTIPAILSWPQVERVGIQEEIRQTGQHTWNISAASQGSYGRTCASQTEVVFLTDVNSISRGDIIDLSVIARDINGRRRTIGGDLWRAVIYNTGSHFASMGRITDHGNGTYTVQFYAGFSGVVKLQIVLVLQREAVKYQREVFLSIESRASWNGIFRSANKTEMSDCFVKREGEWKDKCEYPHPGASGNTVFLCDPPKSLECNTLANISASKHTRNSKTETDIIASHQYLFKAPNAVQVIKSFQDELTIQRRTMSDYIKYQVPQCESDLSDTVSDGYWLGTRWYSLVCQNREWHKAREVQKCLQGKDVYFLGDSTTRQWYQQMLQIAGYPMDVTDKNWRNRVDSLPGEYSVSGTDSYDMLVTDLKNNINFTYHHHALSRHWQIPIFRFPYFVDIIDGLASPECNYVILISLWAHFDTWTTDSFTERIFLLARGIKHLMDRCQNTIVAIKGSHERNNINNYWILYDMNRILKDEFKGLGVFFIDIWDMNFAYAFSNKMKMNIHMPMHLIKEEVYMFLSHACLK
ncbi:NXPE family member 3-like [Saccoglossus kowalevskii]|uniref:NXPE family member 3-like n=1 Tax=Saccoglossus kowalevskii TaxID=10224 RepID=A0ABM0MK11_SACKO|nr:PREDICTED: NXPE family member 3-like [Saccoglossus kowalevskii]